MMDDSRLWESTPIDHAKVIVNRAVSDLPGIRADVGMRHELDCMVLQLRAAVTAVSRKQGPYKIEETVEDQEVPVCSVRNAVMRYWALKRWRRTPRVGGWLARKVKYDKVPWRKTVNMQTITYHGCPHVSVESEDAHLAWLIDRSRDDAA